MLPSMWPPYTDTGLTGDFRTLANLAVTDLTGHATLCLAVG